MAYFSTEPEGLGEFGCGADCSCKSCRSPSNLGEVYEKEEIPSPSPAKPPAAPKVGGWFGEPPFTWPRVSVVPGQLRMPPFEVLTGYAPGQWRLNQAQLARIQRLAEHIARTKTTPSPVTGVRLIGFAEPAEAHVGLRRAVGARAALADAISQLSPGVLGGVKFSAEDGGPTAASAGGVRRVEILLRVGIGATFAPPVRLGEDQATIQPCDKIEPAVLTVPFRIDFGDFLKLVCCAIGRWMVFRTDRPAGRQAWCFVLKHEALLWYVHTEMFVMKIPCVEFRAQYCRRGGATIDVRIALKRFLSRACRPSSLCRTGVCDPSLVCPPSVQPHPELDPRPAKCKTVDALTRSICDNAKRICKIADELNDPSSRDKCEKARTSCKEALERSKSCGSVTDHRHVPAPAQLRQNFRG